MRHPSIELVEKKYLKTDLPEIRVGDTVSVSVLIVEGVKQRIQKFDGLVIAMRGAGVSECIKVRKISSGLGVERIFPIHSPLIKAITVSNRPKVRRAKLYFIRARKGKRAINLK